MSNLYLISQSDSSLRFGCIESAVVVADTEEQARHIHPGTGWRHTPDFPVWVQTPEQVSVFKLGIADDNLPIGVVAISYSLVWADDGK